MSCPQCGGEPTLLGVMGGGPHRVEHLRCRACGWTWSHETPPLPGALVTCEACEGHGSTPRRRSDREDPCEDCNGLGLRRADLTACAACGERATRYVVVDPGMSEPICASEDCVQERV